jgi:hypothetical protein
MILLPFRNSLILIRDIVLLNDLLKLVVYMLSSFRQAINYVTISKNFVIPVHSEVTIFVVQVWIAFYLVMNL